MKLCKLIIRRFRGVPVEAEIILGECNVIVGRNDAGKSTILKALDIFLNDVGASSEMQNQYTEANNCEIEVWLSDVTAPVTIDESVPTTLADEELISDNGCLLLKKTWDTDKAKIVPEMYVRRKKYSQDDFLLLSERDLLLLCRRKGIETTKANGQEFNNVEKRAKLREVYSRERIPFVYEWEKLPPTGKGRGKLIYDEATRILPRFEYFHADASLSESDAAIQKYFKQKSTKILTDAGIADLERRINEGVGLVLNQITSKINDVVASEQQIQPVITFNWGNVVQTGFKALAGEKILPLSFRGDGFRRITMMAYFEHLAEENHEEHQNVIYGFEEPETFLHPKGQEQLHNKLMGMSVAGYQVLTTTHSPTIVANTKRKHLIHVKGTGNTYEIKQNITDFQDIIEDLGITPGNQFVKAFEKARVLVLVEGKDDVNAFTHVASQYKENGVLTHTFADHRIVLVPIGGCDSIKHWLALGTIRDMDKPFYVIQDSDKEAPTQTSPRAQILEELGLHNEVDYWILHKRSIENYIPVRALRRMIPGIEIEYGDFTHIKNLCKSHPAAIALGGQAVANKHFGALSFDELREAFRLPDGQDEFTILYGHIVERLHDQA